MQKPESPLAVCMFGRLECLSRTIFEASHFSYNQSSDQSSFIWTNLTIYLTKFGLHVNRECGPKSASEPRLFHSQIPFRTIHIAPLPPQLRRSSNTWTSTVQPRSQNRSTITQAYNLDKIKDFMSTPPIGLTTRDGTLFKRSKIRSFQTCFCYYCLDIINLGEKMKCLNI